MECSACSIESFRQQGFTVVPNPGFYSRRIAFPPQPFEVNPWSQRVASRENVTEFVGVAGEAARSAVVFLGLKERESGRWESGKLAFGFPVFHPSSSPELWECGNLARFWRDFQGARGKSGKPVFGFPLFAQARHFHSSALLCFRLAGASLSPAVLCSARAPVTDLRFCPGSPA
jgi:hypothetical protein